MPSARDGDLAARISRDAACLLLFDNFEQVVMAAGRSRRARCGLSRRSTCSRRVASRFASGAEREYTLRPLPESRAVELFRQRAGLRSADRRRRIRRRCARSATRLDRLPLAIELAAARVRVLEPPSVASSGSRTDSHSSSRERRDVPERQRALRATIAWSYELLDAAEQRLFSAHWPSSAVARRWTPSRRSPAPTSISSSRWSTRASSDTVAAAS